MSCRHVDVPITPKMLRLAPQLGVLAIVDEALMMGVCALIAAHPHLVAVASDRAPDDSTARRLHDCLVHASHMLADYRLAVAAMLDDLEEASSTL